MEARPQQIDHPDKLARLSSLPLIRRRGGGPVVIVDRAIDEATRERWATQLNRAYLACGCPQAALGMMVTVAVYALTIAIVRPGLGSVWAYLGLGVLAAIVGSAIGKLIGLRGADKRLGQLVRDIRAQWSAPSREGKEPWSCG
jgi:hypothetical protein